MRYLVGNLLNRVAEELRNDKAMGVSSESSSRATGE